MASPPSSNRRGPKSGGSKSGGPKSGGPKSGGSKSGGPKSSGPKSGGALVRRSYSQVTGERPTSEPPRKEIAPGEMRKTGRGGASLSDRFLGDDRVSGDEATVAEARQAVRRGRSGRSGNAAAPPTSRGSSRSSGAARRTRDEGGDELGGALSHAVEPRRATRLEGRVKEASRAFKRERFGEAARILRPIAKEAPSVPEVRELLGVTLYRLGHWRPAARELEAFVELTGSTEQHPVLMDCQRAVGRHREVDRLWTELREASPGASLVMEGRIVAAGSLADQGKLDEAIRLLDQGKTMPKRPDEHHLRRAYALADLYERAGSLARARELFGWLAGIDPEFADVVDRVRALR